MLLEQSLENIEKRIVLTSCKPPEYKELDSLLSDAFMSSISMSLIQEQKHPTFGFYSLSHNYIKLEKMIMGQLY